MEIEIDVNSNKIFRKLYLKIRVPKKTNFILYYFLVKSKPHEGIDLLITGSVNIYLTKIPIAMKTCFSQGKLMKYIGNPLSKRTSPF